MIVGLVGTGMLGAAVGERLLSRGIGVRAYNRTAARARALAELGAEPAGTPAEAARGADAVITCVTDAAAVRAVSFGPGGAAGACGPGAPVCEMSTIGPADSRSIAAGYARRGAAMIDTPVMGGPDAARAGRLVVMAAGDERLLEAARPALDAVSERVFHLGPQGSAHAVKLSMNLQIAMLALSLSEGVELARASSVDPALFLDVLDSTYFSTGMSRRKARAAISGGVEPTFLLRNMAKDLAVLRDEAASLGADLPCAGLAERIYREAAASGLGGLDYTGLIGRRR